MKVKITLILVFLGFFLGFHLALAGVVINEVQLSPTDGRFIELYNSDSASVDLTDWYIQRKTASGSSFGSLITKTDLAGKAIAPNSYFLIARTALSNADVVVGDMTLTESNTIQIKNADGNVVDKVGWGDCGDTCVAGNPADGEGLQKQIDGSWKICASTPGAENSTCENNNNENNNNNNNNNGGNVITTSSSGGGPTTAKTEPKPKVVEIPTMKAKILANALAFTGEPLELQASILGYQNEKIMLGRAFWNFGDGASLEQVNKFEKFSHTYFYPGEYALSLEYYPNTFATEPEAMQKITMKVLPTTVTIAKVGDYKDFFIELDNNATSDIDISGWYLKGVNKTFTLPKNSVILSKKSMMIAGKITGFTFGDQYNLKLYSATGELVFDYGNRLSSTQNFSSDQAARAVNKKVALADTSNIVSLDQNNGQDLLASVGVADLPTSGQNKNPYLFYGGFAVLLGASGGTVYYLRRKRIPEKAGDDFEILDE